MNIINNLSQKMAVTPRLLERLNYSTDIKRDYSNYCECYKLAKSLPNFKERVTAFRNLLNKMLEEYHPPTFDYYIHDLAYEFTLWDECKDDEPPYSSISTQREDASIQFTKAKILILYSEVRDALFLYSTMMSPIEDNVVENKYSLKEKPLTINKIIDMNGILQHQEQESREELDRKLNNQLRTYNKIAKRILEIKSPTERINDLDGLIEVIGEECKSFIDKDSSQEWDYTITTVKGLETVEKKYKGSPDYELYQMAFENPKTRLSFVEMLKKGQVKGMSSSVAEFEVHTLYSALKTERNQVEKEIQCMTKKSKNTLDIPDHFELDIPQIKQKLKKVLMLLKQSGYISQTVTNADFLYLCSGEGRPSKYPVQWLKDDDELGYFVKTFFKKTKNKYERAAKCFLLNNGKKPDAKNLRTNATNKNDKQIPIRNLVKIIS